MQNSSSNRSRRLSESEWRLVSGIVALLVAILVLLVWRMSGQRSPILSNANPFDSEQVARGQQVYAAQCASCHGANLEGQANWQSELPTGGRPAPPHDASGHTWHHGDAYVFDVTKYGGQANSPPDYKNNMPAFGDKLTDRQIWDVLAFIKSRWPPDIQQAQIERSNATPTSQ